MVSETFILCTRWIFLWQISSVALPRGLFTPISSTMKCVVAPFHRHRLGFRVPQNSIWFDHEEYLETRLGANELFVQVCCPAERCITRGIYRGLRHASKSACHGAMSTKCPCEHLLADFNSGCVTADDF